MKLSKALVTELITQVVAIASVIAHQKLSSGDLAIAIAIFTAVESIGAIVAGQFATAARIESLAREIRIFTQGR